MIIQEDKTITIPIDVTAKGVKTLTLDLKDYQLIESTNTSMMFKIIKVEEDPLTLY